MSSDSLHESVVRITQGIVNFLHVDMNPTVQYLYIRIEAPLHEKKFDFENIYQFRPMRLSNLCRLLYPRGKVLNYRTLMKPNYAIVRMDIHDKDRTFSSVISLHKSNFTGMKKIRIGPKKVKNPWYRIARTYFQDNEHILHELDALRRIQI